MQERGTDSGNRPTHRATYSLCTAPSVPKYAARLFVASALSEVTMTPEVSRSSRFKADLPSSVS